MKQICLNGIAHKEYDEPNLPWPFEEKTTEDNSMAKETKGVDVSNK